MLNGMCPKCDSREVYTDINMPSRGESMQTIVVRVGVFASDRAILDNYVCSQCGYHESYLQDSNKMQQLVENWSLVQVQER